MAQLGKFKGMFGARENDVTVGEVVTKLVTDTTFVHGKWKLFAFHLGIETEYVNQVQQIIDVKGDYVTAFWKLLEVYVSVKGNGALVKNILEALQEHRLIQLKEQIELLGNGRLVSELYKPFVPATQHTNNRSFDLGVVSTQLEQLTTDENNLSLDNTIVVNNVLELGKDEDIANDFLHKHHKMSNLKILKAKRIGKSISNPFAFHKKNNSPRPLAISLAPHQGKPALVIPCIIETLNSSSFTKSIGARVSKYFKKNNPSLSQGTRHHFGNVLQDIHKCKTSSASSYSPRRLGAWTTIKGALREELLPEADDSVKQINMSDYISPSASIECICNAIESSRVAKLISQDPIVLCRIVEFANELGCDSVCIEEIRIERLQNYHDQINKILQEWVSRNGKAATTNKLSAHLKKLGFIAIEEIMTKQWPSKQIVYMALCKCVQRQHGFVDLDVSPPQSSAAQQQDLPIAISADNVLEMMDEIAFNIEITFYVHDLPERGHDTEAARVILQGTFPNFHDDFKDLRTERITVNQHSTFGYFGFLKTNSPDLNRPLQIKMKVKKKAKEHSLSNIITKIRGSIVVDMLGVKVSETVEIASSSAAGRTSCHPFYSDKPKLGGGVSFWPS